MRISISVFWNHKIDRGFGTKVRRYEGTFYEGTKVHIRKFYAKKHSKKTWLKNFTLVLRNGINNITKTNIYDALFFASYTP